MLIIPAIDLLDVKVVRLEQGDYRRLKVYSEKPIEVAGRWKDKGADLIHIVDLDGARDGKPKNLESVEKIIRTTGVEVELGGGIRDLATIKDILDLGVSRVVLGTAVIKNEEFSRECILQYGVEKITFSVDMKNKEVLMEGWKIESGYTFHSLLTRFQLVGLKRMIYTDVLTDGTLKGPNIEGIYDILVSTSLDLIVSGGISGVDDIRRIKNLKRVDNKRVSGIIIGKALYEGRIDLAEAIQVAEEKSRV